MSSPISPEMLIGGADLVHAWTERGDCENAGEEEGRGQEGHQEEEVGAPGWIGRGGGPITSPFSFLGLEEEVD
jgi:hypothetical protein